MCHAPVSGICHNDNVVMILHMFVTQVDTLQRNLASVIQFVSERSRHSSSSQDTPPLRSGHMMTASLDLNQQPPPTTTLPSSMTMSLPPSLLLPAPVTLSKSCDSLAQVCMDNQIMVCAESRDLNIACLIYTVKISCWTCDMNGPWIRRQARPLWSLSAPIDHLRR